MLSAGKSIFHCLISTFHAMKHTNKSLNFTFHTTKYSQRNIVIDKEMRSKEWGVSTCYCVLTILVDHFVAIC